MSCTNFKTPNTINLETCNESLKDCMTRVYKHMFLGLSLTGFIAYIVGTTPAVHQAIFGSYIKMAFVILAPFALLTLYSIKSTTMRYTTAKSLFYTFSCAIGVLLSSIFLVYTNISIARAFFIAASMFGSMSLYGYVTKKDLTDIGSFLIMGVFGLMILFVINIFLDSTVMQTLISIAAIVMFLGLTAYDTQKIKQTYLKLEGEPEIVKKVAIHGALDLYLDIINIFIHLLHFIGEKD